MYYLANVHMYCKIQFWKWNFWVKVTCTGTLKFFKFILEFLAALGLLCCMKAFSSCGEWGHSLVRRVGFSLQWLLLLPSAGFRVRGDISRGAWAELLHGMWNLLGPGLEP